jgi:hypothetical protein
MAVETLREKLARDIHEAHRAMVQAGHAVSGPAAGAWVEYDGLSTVAKLGRRMMADALLLWAEWTPLERLWDCLYDAFFLEPLAQRFHDAGAAAATAGLTHRPVTGPVLTWAELPEEKRAGRYLAAQHLLGRWLIAPRPRRPSLPELGMGVPTARAGFNLAEVAQRAVEALTPHERQVLDARMQAPVSLIRCRLCDGQGATRLKGTPGLYSGKYLCEACMQRVETAEAVLK